MIKVVCSIFRPRVEYYIYSAVHRSLGFGSAFSFSGEYSYLRLAGTVCSVGSGEWVCDTGSEGGMEARASLGSVSGVRSMMEEMDCLVDPWMGFGARGESRGAGVSAGSGISRSLASIFIGYESSRSSSPSSDSDSSSISCCSASGSIAVEPRGLSSADPRCAADTGGRGAFGS